MKLDHVVFLGGRLTLTEAITHKTQEFSWKTQLFWFENERCLTETEEAPNENGRQDFLCLFTPKTHSVQDVPKGGPQPLSPRGPQARGAKARGCPLPLRPKNRFYGPTKHPMPQQGPPGVN